jgi:hypothetical protein
MLGRRLVLVGLGVLSAGACGGESGEFTDAPIALSELPARYAAASCTAYERCAGADLVKLFLNGVDCTTLTERRILNGTFPMIQSKIDGGTVHYDGAKASACINAIAARTCATFNDRDPPECLAAIDGTVDLGGDCTLDDECKGIAFCQSTTNTCPGTCTSLLVAGMACSKNDHCAAGLVCSEETKLCVAPTGVDQPCEYGKPPCAAGLVCLGKDDNAKTPGTCKASAQAFAADDGAACDAAKGQMCKTGLSCAAISLTLVPWTITYQCVKAGSYAVGAACKPAWPEACTAGNYCKVSNALTFDGTCAPRPQVGEACDDKKGPPCRTGAVCVANKCQDFAANGVSCTGDAMCYSENCASGACEARLPCK